MKVYLITQRMTNYLFGVYKTKAKAIRHLDVLTLGVNFPDKEKVAFYASATNRKLKRDAIYFITCHKVQ